MSLGGSNLDLYANMYHGLIGHESQQKGSVLTQAVMIKPSMGDKNYIDILGRLDAITKNGRNETKTKQNITAERRQMQETTTSVNHNIDIEDLIKYVSDPQSEIVQAAVYGMGRSKDSVIMDAISGNAVVTTNGSTANQALTLSVTVNDHSLDPIAETSTGDVGLTTGKLKKAITLLSEGYGYQSGRRLICVAPSRQLINLTTESQTVSGDYRTGRPLDGPGIFHSLSGYLGIDFIAYEDTGLSGTDEQAFLFTDDAITLGVFKPLQVAITQDTQTVGHPTNIHCWESIGAVRNYESKVVKIICDPLA